MLKLNRSTIRRVRAALILVAAALLADETPAPKDPAIVYLQAHVKAVEASAAIDALNAEYAQKHDILRKNFTRLQTEETSALHELAKHLGCTDGVDTEKLACNPKPAPAKP